MYIETKPESKGRALRSQRRFFQVRFLGPSPCTGCRIPPGDAAEDGAGHEARAAGVVVVVEAADDLAGGGEAGDRVA